MNTVTNQEYNLAIKNTENIRILNRAVYNYKNFLDEDDLESCKSVALWRCLKNFESKKGNSFKNSLYRFAIWECKAILRKRRVTTRSIENFDVAHNKKDENIFELLEFLNDDEKLVVSQKVLQGLSFKDIAKTNSWEIVEVKKMFKTAMNSLRGVYSNID